MVFIVWHPNILFRTFPSRITNNALALASVSFAFSVNLNSDNGLYNKLTPGNYPRLSCESMTLRFVTDISILLFVLFAGTMRALYTQLCVFLWGLFLGVCGMF